MIELLIVIAIIGILSALLLSSLGRAHEKARSIWCQSNLKQIGLAMRMYLDANGTWPVNPRLLEGYSSKFTGATFQNVPSNASIWCCPSWKAAQVKDPIGNYNLNVNGTGDANKLNLTLANHPLGIGMGPGRLHGRQEYEIANPADMIVAGEMDIAGVSAPPLSPLWQNFPFNHSYGYMFVFRHNQRANALLGDGRVELANHDGLIGKNDIVRRRWNYDHQPHNENWR